MFDHFDSERPGSPSSSQNQHRVWGAGEGALLLHFHVHGKSGLVQAELLSVGSLGLPSRRPGGEGAEAPVVTLTLAWDRVSWLSWKPVKRGLMVRRKVTEHEYLSVKPSGRLFIRTEGS